MARVRQAQYKAATELLALFEDQHLFSGYLIEPVGAVLVRAPFEMDIYASARRTYPDAPALTTLAGLQAAVPQLQDPQVLGNLIFSRYREITHWSSEHLDDPENRQWFIVALRRLVALTQPGTAAQKREV
ncbi:hypothetical protein [Lacticaseibacillus daqingensis]|uniref:hypothetical protein n=1 Tax=Lacticaseibacillus daqingensis TaxID=2486014 RepID=UPI000F779E7A|nr:hypothetical protein [Lacticaseibacillus daqingensis]